MSAPSLSIYHHSLPAVPRADGLVKVSYGPAAGAVDVTLVKFVPKESVASTLGYTGAQAVDAEKDAGSGAASSYVNGRRVLVVALGTKDKKVSAEAVRKAGTQAVNKLKSLKLTSAAFELPEVNGLESTKVAECLAQAAVLANYSFDRYFTKEDKLPTIIQSVSIEGAADASAAVDTAVKMAQGTIFARDIANERSDEMHPARMQLEAEKLAAVCGYEVHTLVGEELVAKGMHTIYAVGQAARHAPRYIELFRKGDPEHPEDVIVLVGKGVCYDSGGLSLKPTSGMVTMYGDKGGASAVLGAALAAHLLNIKRNIVFVVGAVENAIDSNAYKPSCVIKTHKGLTVENGNSDAEGRLVLSDCLSYAQERYRPHTVVDFATLTGACVVALGEYAAGLFTNNRNLATSLVKAGEVRGERAWPMPIFEEHKAEIASGSAVADLYSMGEGAYGGACTAAAFLENFIGWKAPGSTEETKPSWAHIDIAGPGLYSRTRGYMNKGCTGFAVQLITEYLMNAPAGAPPKEDA